MGLAQGPDGSLYVSDSVKGKIWRITFKGDCGAFGSAQLARMEDAQDRAGAHRRDPARAERRARTRGAETRVRSCTTPIALLPPSARRKGDGTRFPPCHRDPMGLGRSQLRSIAVVLNGLQGEIEVEGQTLNGVMPPNAFLTDDQAAQLLTYLRQNFGNYAAGIKPGDVAEVRAKPPMPWPPATVR